MDEKVIDITRYPSGLLEGRAGRTFSVWGGEGPRARLALPVWRAITLLQGERGGIVLLPPGADDPQPSFILDLVREPACTDCSSAHLGVLLEREAPAIVFDPEGEVAVLLGATEKGSWYLQVWGRSSGEPLDGKVRETLLFLAGECTGLLFYQELTERDA